MEDFKNFLSGTAGKQLVNFWLDCEYFKDCMEKFDAVAIVEERNRLFRYTPHSLTVLRLWLVWVGRKYITVTSMREFYVIATLLCEYFFIEKTQLCTALTEHSHKYGT